jgi:hypothetical protein
MEPAIFLSAAKIANYGGYAKVHSDFSFAFHFIQPPEFEDNLNLIIPFWFKKA